MARLTEPPRILILGAGMSGVCMGIRLKQAGLQVSDRITLRIDGSGDVLAALEAFRAFIADETLTIEWGGAGFAADYEIEHALDESRWRIGLSRRPD